MLLKIYKNNTIPFTFVLTAIFALLATVFTDQKLLNIGKVNCSLLLNLSSGYYAALSTIFLIVFVFVYLKKILSNSFLSVSAGLIVGGGLFHIWERFNSRCISDYWHIDVLYFNLADIFISAGIIAFLSFYFREETR